MFLPSEVKIFDCTYKIQYVMNASEVDIHKRESLWGQIDYWTRTIRVYQGERSAQDIWQTIWHEICHGFTEHLHMNTQKGALSDQESVIDLMATAINTIIHDNWRIDGRFSDESTSPPMNESGVDLDPDVWGSGS